MAKRSWTQNRDAKAAKLDSIASMLDGKFVKTQNAKELL